MSSLIFALNLCLLHLCHTIKLNELSVKIPADEGDLNITTLPTYRVSVPKLKQPLNRVPAHLQGIRYINEDEEDVIHVVEPPQHFQLLKRIINQKGDKRKRGITDLKSTNQMLKSTAMKTSTMKTLSASKLQTKVNAMPEFILRQLVPVKQQLKGIKVNRPVTPLQTYVYKRSRKPVGSNEVSADLASQETHTQHSQIMPPPLPLPLPREILASVRKTERLLQNQPQQKQHSHRVTQRQKHLTTHTIIKGQGFEKNKFQQGSDHKIMKQKCRRARARRDAQTNLKLENSSAGARRADKATSTLDALKNAKLDIQKGTKLLIHLDELLRNANMYLPDKGEVVDLNEKHNINNETLTQSLVYPGSVVLRQFVEKSINATNLLKQKFSPKRNVGGNKKRRAYNNFNENKQSTHRNRLALEDESTTSYHGRLLYEDVMANIRSMWLAKNLKFEEEQKNRNLNGKDVTADLNSSLPILPIDNDEMVEVNELQQYINQLQRLAKFLPNNNDSTVPGKEAINPTNITSSSDWYFINSEGSIYGARLGSRPKPSASLFHRFPDIPIERGAKVNGQRLL